MQMKYLTAIMIFFHCMFRQDRLLIFPTQHLTHGVRRTSNEMPLHRGTGGTGQFKLHYIQQQLVEKFRDTTSDTFNLQN